MILHDIRNKLYTLYIYIYIDIKTCAILLDLHRFAFQLFSNRRAAMDETKNDEILKGVLQDGVLQTTLFLVFINGNDLVM